jgi:hypothetical protein
MNASCIRFKPTFEFKRPFEADLCRGPCNRGGKIRNCQWSRLGDHRLQVFLSYASEDKAIAEPIAFSIRARGHMVFLDRDDLPAGGDFDLRIEQAVARSDLFVFLISPASISKGRFTLTELEFARRKWRKADGRVLPVLAKPTPFADIPSFLKSVTVLEPQGNIAAEVAAAVEPLAQGAVEGQMLVYGGLGAVSGALTWPLMRLLSPILPFDKQKLLDVPVGMELAGVAFGAALVGAFAYFLRLRLRQWVIVLFVLAGWFVAIELILGSHAQIPRSWTQAEQDQPCTEPASQSPSDLEAAIECQSKRAARFEGRFNEVQNYWRSLALWLAAGSVGAMITALGVPPATRRSVPLFFFLAIPLAGGAIAAAWFAISGAFDSSSDIVWYALFISWQGAVAAVIGRAIR